MTVVIMTGCGRDEKQSFVDATVESTCLFFETDDIFDPELSDKVKEIFEKHGFETSDEALEELKNRYAEDTEVQSAILEGISQCGGDFAEELELEAPEADPVMEELEEVIEEAEEEMAAAAEEEGVVEESSDASESDGSDEGAESEVEAEAEIEVEAEVEAEASASE